AILHACRYYFKKQKPDGNVYDPHLALLMSFLHLYGHLQQSINQLLKKHLDYFYQDVVGIKPRKETLDTVHLVLEPVDRINPFFLNKGELLTAEIAGSQEKLLYALENDVQVSGAQIRELKTIFVSNVGHREEHTTEGATINEKQVYKGDYPVWQP